MDVNGLAVGPAHQTLPEDVQGVDGERLAGEHVCGLQSTFAGVSIEPGADEGLVSACRSCGAARHHAAVAS